MGEGAPSGRNHTAVWTGTEMSLGRRVPYLTAARSFMTLCLASPKSISVFGAVAERVVDAGVAGGQAALQHDDVRRLPDVEHGHAVDRACRDRRARRGSRCRSHRSPSRRRCRELVVDLVQLLDDLVRHAGLGEKHVHVSGKAARDGVDRVADVDAARGQRIADLAHRVLRLRDRHAVAGDDDDGLRRRQELGDFLHVGLARGAAGARCGPVRRRLRLGAESAEDDVDASSGSSPRT